MRIPFPKTPWGREMHLGIGERCGAAFWLGTPHEALSGVWGREMDIDVELRRSDIKGRFYETQIFVCAAVPTLRCARCGVANKLAAPQR